jgi:hypothetical protein
MKSKLRRALPVRYDPSYVEVLDGRSRVGREVRDNFNQLIQDLGGSLSHQQTSLAKRAVWLEFVISREELRIARGEGVDIQPHVALVGSLLGLYRTLGIKRVAREARLSDYLKRAEP